MKVSSLLALLATLQDKLYVCVAHVQFFCVRSKHCPCSCTKNNSAISAMIETYSVPLWIVTFTSSSCLALFPLAVTCAGAICFM